MIVFQPLREKHFTNLLTWLGMPHVKAWWDTDVVWTPELVHQKYIPYVQGYKLENGVRKAMHAFVVCVHDHPIGYIQAYNAYDFPRDAPLEGLPESLGALDVFIGEPDWIGKGFGSRVLKDFLTHFCDERWDHMFTDPDRHNHAAIRAYEKAGFCRFKEVEDAEVVWMLRQYKKPAIRWNNLIPN